MKVVGLSFPVTIEKLYENKFNDEYFRKAQKILRGVH